MKDRFISIAMSYFNRKRLLELTLKTIVNSKYNHYQIIVVDDGSDQDQRLEDLLAVYPMLKLIRIEPESKWYKNSCVPNNIAIKASQGQIIILQNPQCCHITDILTSVSEIVNDSNYYTALVYNLNEERMPILNEFRDKNIYKYITKVCPQVPAYMKFESGWFNHPDYRSTNYHFCSAITANNMKKLKGFDQKYAYGLCYDDNQLLDRIKLLNLNIVTPLDSLVIHQFHQNIKKPQQYRLLQRINKQIYLKSKRMNHDRIS